MKTNFDITSARELDSRTNDGVDVRLLWQPAPDRIAVEVVDGRNGERFALSVSRTDALDAFHHPYAYAARGDCAFAAAEELPAETDRELFRQASR
jgi:hypothetical protein